MNNSGQPVGTAERVPSAILILRVSTFRIPGARTISPEMDAQALGKRVKYS